VKKAKKDFKNDPNAEQQLRKVQAKASAGVPALQMFESGTSTTKLIRGLPAANESSVFTLGLTDVSGTGTGVEKKNLTSTASVSTEPQGAVVPEEMIDEKNKKKDEFDEESSEEEKDAEKEEKKLKVPTVDKGESGKANKHTSKHSHSSSKHMGKHERKQSNKHSDSTDE